MNTFNFSQALSKSCLALSRLDLDECVLITDSSLASLSSHCPGLSRYVTFHYVTVTNISSSLSLSHCELITDEGIRLLGQSQSAREKLTTLELDNCPLVTDRGLEHLMACRNLNRIEL